MPTIDPSILKAALSGLEAQLALVNDHIAQVRSALGRRGRGRPPASTDTVAASSHAPRKRGGRRQLSPEGRARIIAATKARWARIRQEKAAKEAAKTAKRASKKSVVKKTPAKKRVVKKEVAPAPAPAE